MGVFFVGGGVILTEPARQYTDVIPCDDWSKVLALSFDKVQSVKFGLKMSIQHIMTI